MPGEPAVQQLQKEERIQKLKAAIGLTVFDICSELETDLGVKYTPEAVAAISNLTEKKIERSADYLEAFAKHAKRSNITADDVKLLTRGNKNLNNHLAKLQKEVPVKQTTGVGPGKHVKSVKKNKDGGSSSSSSKAGPSATVQPLID